MVNRSFASGRGGRGGARGRGRGTVVPAEDEAIHDGQLADEMCDDGASLFLGDSLASESDNNSTFNVRSVSGDGSIEDDDPDYLISAIHASFEEALVFLACPTADLFDRNFQFD